VSELHGQRSGTLLPAAIAMTLLVPVLEQRLEHASRSLAETPRPAIRGDDRLATVRHAH